MPSLPAIGIQAIVVALLLIISLTPGAGSHSEEIFRDFTGCAHTFSSVGLPGYLSRRHPSPPRSLDIAAPMSIPAPRTPRVEVTVDVPTPPALKPVLQPNFLATVPAIPAAKPVHTGSFGDPSGVPVQQQASAASRAPALPR